MKKNKKDEHLKDNKLLEIYRFGWDSATLFDKPREEKELNEYVVKNNPLHYKAYIIGFYDFIVGDDVSSVDLQTNDQILKRIKA